MHVLVEAFMGRSGLLSQVSAGKLLVGLFGIVPLVAVALPVAASSRPATTMSIFCEGLGEVVLRLPHGVRGDGSIQVADAGPVSVRGVSGVTMLNGRTGHRLTKAVSSTGPSCSGLPFSGVTWSQLGLPDALPAGIEPRDVLSGTLLPDIAVAPPTGFAAASNAAFAVDGLTIAGFSYASEIGNFLATRPGSCSVALRRPGSTTQFVFTRGAASNVTASIVKVDIMATLLWQAQNAGRALTSWERYELGLMITQSDNTAASALWNHVGQGSAVAAFNRLVPMPSTVMGTGGYWGLTTTNAPDQAALVAYFAWPNAVLNDSSRQLGLSLMHQVVAWQAWGVSAGPPPGSVALKNGWLPRTDGWHVNSIGAVTPAGPYVITVLTSSSTATEAQQIATIEGVSRIVWQHEGGTSYGLPYPGYIDHLLQRGSSDAAQVRVLQTRLDQVGYDVHGVDGIFGPATYAAARAYQSSRGLIPDGIVGPATGGALGIWR